MQCKEKTRIYVAVFSDVFYNESGFKKIPILFNRITNPLKIFFISFQRSDIHLTNDTLTWLQISDLHICRSTDWTVQRKALLDLAQKIKPDFIIATGDFRHLRYNKKFDDALNFLNDLQKITGLNKEDFFLIPGNHDVNVRTTQTRKKNIAQIYDNLDSVKTSAKTIDTFTDTMLIQSVKQLLPAFSEYNDFVKAFYNNEVSDQRIENATNVYCVSWHDRINILGINTAIISCNNREKHEIADIVSLSNLTYDDSLPTIAIAHHSPNDLYEPIYRRMKQLFNQMKVKAYLCGDRHLSEANALKSYGDIVENQIPYIICGKTAIEQSDDYSDINVLNYKVEKDGRAYVKAIKYNSGKGHYVSADDFDIDFDKPFSFKLFTLSRKDYRNLFNDSEQFDSLSTMFTDIQETIQHVEYSYNTIDIFGFGMDLQVAEPWLEEVSTLCRNPVSFRALVLAPHLFPSEVHYDSDTLQRALERLNLTWKAQPNPLVSIEVRQSDLPYPFFGLKIDNYLYFSFMIISENAIINERPFYRILLDKNSLQNTFVKSFFTWFDYLWKEAKEIFTTKTEQEET